MCRYCKCNELAESTTTHVVVFQDCTIIIKNVPCLECTQCGERYFTMEVSRQLEKIVQNARKIAKELLITDYDSVA